MEMYKVGVITDGELGCNFALNLSSKGYSAVVYNTDVDSMTRENINNYVKKTQKNGISVATSTEMLINLINNPRIIFIISRKSLYAENILQELFELLESNDIIVDTCDTNYKVTATRCRNFEKKNIWYIGAGISGSENEILTGASLMIGGSRDAYDSIVDMIKNISSRYGKHMCCKYMGPDGAGQYVKMIHNGIEYGIMHSISEAISILKHIGGMDRLQLSEIIYEWSVGDNESFMLQAAYDILSRKNSDTEDYLSDIVTDKIGFSKSVAWLITNAVELSVPVPSIYASLNTRFISSIKDNKKDFLNGIDNTIDEIYIINDRKKSFIEDVKNSLYISVVCVYAQAFHLLKRASDVYIWGTFLIDAAIAFQGGSFIRSRVLDRIIDAFTQKPDLKHLFEDAYFINEINKCLPSLRRVVGISIESGVSIPAISEAFSYINSLSLDKLDTGFVELMRDYIQQSGFEITDKPKVKFTAEWDNYENLLEIKEIK